jgi:2-polyprenyl-6-methoxyphenol hydroxylase-like FAD-dependent oxidoreductase
MEDVKDIVIVSCNPYSCASCVRTPVTSSLFVKDRRCECYAHHTQVGGSLSALITALLLSHITSPLHPAIPRIKSITILERSLPSRLKDQGAGLRLGPQVISTLRQYTNWEVERYAEKLDTYRVLGTKGEDIMVRSAGEDWGSSWGRLFHGLRNEFENKDGGVLGADRDLKVVRRYRTGCAVHDVKREGEKMRVNFTNEYGGEESIIAELVVAADGASSTLRSIVEPETKRSYVGYVCLRGMVPTEELSESSQKAFHRAGGFCFPEAEAQAVYYTVPSNEEVSEVSGAKTCLNWVWYQSKTEEELADLMTDAEGVRHKYTLPVGHMRRELAERMIEDARREGMAPQILECIEKTEAPFAQVVTDNIVGRNEYFEGKLLLVGDAAAGQR